MFLPIGTDAPIYHRPYATFGLIAANVWAFVITQGGTAVDGWLLTFGDGLHPTQWVKSAFLHFGILHLLGNMLFLFIFGLIIEGKLGAVRFLLLYLPLCLLDGMVDQLLMLNYTGPTQGTGGASGVIFALMVIAWLWAPQNCIEFLFIFRFHYISSFEVTLQTVALYYLGTNLFFAWLLGFEVSTPVLHLLGAGVGLGVGLLLLKWNWVDCEGWDLLTLRGGDHPAHNKIGTYEQVPREIPNTDEPVRQSRIRQIERRMAQGEFEEAWQAYTVMRNAPRPQYLPRQPLEKLLKGVVRLNNWNAAVALLQEVLERFDQDTLSHRFALASILTHQLHRPRAALNVLQDISRLELDPREAQRFEQIRQAAIRQIDAGVLEIREPS